MEENKRSFEQFLEEGAPSLELTDFDQHPSEEILTSYAYGQLETSRQAHLSAHVATCSSCHKRVRKLREERKNVENQLAPFLSDPRQVEIKVEEEKGSWIGRLKKNMDSFLQKAMFPNRRTIYAHIGAYGLLAALLFGINKLLDWLLMPPSSPLGSTAKVSKWWTHLYWILLPWGLFLMVSSFRIFFSSSDDEDKERGEP